MRGAAGWLLAAALFLSGCTGGVQVQSTLPAPAEAAVVPADPAAVQISGVRQLAADTLARLRPGEGEAAVRAVYRWLVESVWFADPVYLDAWYYLSDDDGAPYLENRALGPLLFGIGSCEDFAAAAVLLLEAAGLQARYVAGYTLSVEGVFVDHAWAVVALDGRWYHLDPQLEQNVTRDNLLTWRYYLKSDETMAADHRWGENLIALWDDITPDEGARIRRDHTPPACPADHPAPVQVSAPLPQRPDMSDVLAVYDTLRRESGRTPPAGLRLDVEPPVLSAAHHVTPPLSVRDADREVGYGGGFLEGEELRLYRLLAGSVAGAEVPLPAAVSDERARYVAGAVLDDHPALWWAEFTPGRREGARYLRVDSTHGLSAGEIAAAQREIGARGEELLSRWDGTEFEMALAIHDHLAGTVDYDRQQIRRHSGSIYGVLTENTAYCDGYARAFQYLANLAGLEAVYIQGRSARGVPHAWNAVRLDGRWHYLDVTWDRPLGENDGVYHDYFLLSLDEMRKEHTWDDTQYPALPDTPEHIGYYRRAGTAVGIPGTDPQTAYSDAFYRQLLRLEGAPADWAPVFLEVKVLGEADWQEWSGAFVENIFHILRELDHRARADGLPVEIALDTSVRCNLNATTRVITFYPKVKASEGE